MSRIKDIFRHAIRSGGGRLILLLIGVGFLWLGSAAVDYFIDRNKLDRVKIERRKALRALCTEIGCTYLTRARNRRTSRE